jgi:hypothetical protein
MWRLAVISIIGAGLAGCGTLPKGATGPAVPIARIVEAVRCQVAAAFAPGNPDPAGMIGWKMLTTVTINGDSGFEVRPGVTGVAGKAGKASWKAATGGTSFIGTTKRSVETEYKVRDIRTEIERAPCPDPDDPAAARGLDIAGWLRGATAGQPPTESGATPLKATYKNTFAVGASVGGGLTFTFTDFSLSIEGNKANVNTTYTIDVRLGPQTGPNAPFMMGGENFGLNEFGAFDDFSDLRRDRDEEEEEEKEEETVIRVPPGQTITIGP